MIGKSILAGAAAVLLANTALAATVNIPVGANIQSYISANPGGTVFNLPVGTWHGQQINPKIGDQFIGDPNGGTVLTGDDTTSFLYASDGTENLNVLFKNITVTHYNRSTSECYLGAVHGTNNWTFDHATFTLNNCTGLVIGPNNRVIGGRYSYNAHAGIEGGGAGFSVNGVEIDHNNTRHDDLNNDAAGIKITEANNVQVLNSNVHDNYGQGIWFDIDSSNITISGNAVTNNVLNGIMYEISYGPCSIQNNTVTGNGGWGIYISNSSGCDVGGNTIDIPASGSPINGGGFGGVGLIYDNRGSGAQGPYNTTNNNIHDNTTIFRGVAGVVGYFYDYNPSVGSGFVNNFNHNTYYVPNLTTRFWKYDGASYVFSGWQGIGKDTTGQAIVGLPSGDPQPPLIIAVGSRVRTSANLNIRRRVGGRVLCTQSAGSLGTVIGGPTVSGGYKWWNINFDYGCDGWGIENYLSVQ